MARIFSVLAAALACVLPALPARALQGADTTAPSQAAGFAAPAPPGAQPSAAASASAPCVPCAPSTPLPAATPNSGKFSIDAAKLQVSTSDTLLTASVTWASNPNPVFDSWLLGLTAKLPSSTTDQDANTDLDQFTNGWRVGLTLGRYLVTDKSETRVSVLKLQLLPEFGLQQFVYYPQAGNASSSSWHLSSDGTFDLLYFTSPLERGAPWAVEATYRFGADWAASPAEGVVTGSSPALVTGSKVVADAIVHPSMMGRLFWYRDLIGVPFALGPSIAATTTGPTGRAVTFNDTIAGRAEFWLYYLPTATPVDLRIGASPYVTWYLRGTDPQGRTVVPGVLLQVRYGTPQNPVYAY
jgi:hypothetical protein